MKLAIVIPVFNERDSLAALFASIEEHAAPYDYRVIFIDDGSTDGSWDVLRTLAEKSDRVDLIRFRRNFGKTPALAAGIARAEGDVLVTLDADLQDDPRELPRLLAALDGGLDLVVGWKQKRNDPWHKTIPSRIYNGWVSRTFNLQFHDVNSGFKVMRMEVARRLPLRGELHRMIVVNAHAFGYRVGEVPVTHHPRRFGISKFGLTRFVTGGLDVVATWFRLRHGDAPLHVLGRVGFASLTLGLIFTIAAVSIATGLTPIPATHDIIAVIFFAVCAVVLVVAGLLTFLLGLVADLVGQHTPACLDPESCVAEEIRRA
jgi:glycosyltransferase involved in cell wall biosynthesis